MEYCHRLLPVLALWLAGAQAADWPQFLGPQRSGVADAAEEALPDSLKPNLEAVWKIPVGSGFAGPVVAGGKVIICHREGSDMVTQALDAKTGKQIWRTSYVTDYVDSFGFDNGPRATPAVHGGKVFVFGPEGRVTSIDFESGKELWSFDTASELESPQGFFGRAPSPLVTNGAVIIAAGGPKGGVIGLNEGDGKLAWSSVADEAGYASPVVLPDQAGILAWMRNSLWIVDSQGHQRSLPLRARMEASVNAATPIYCGDGRWFVTAGYGVGANLVKVTADRDLALQWQKDDLMDCHYSTPVYRNGHVFGFHGRQETGQTLRCIDVMLKTVLWESPTIPGGTLLLVGEKLLVVTEQGELWLVRATPEKFDQLSAVQILRAGHRSHAAFADGILYARDSEQLAAFPLR